MESIFREECVELAVYMLENKCTIRQAAKEKGIPKSTIHKRITKQLKRSDYKLYKRIKKLMDKNKKEGCSRGGQATGRKYRELRKEKNNKIKE